MVCLQVHVAGTLQLPGSVLTIGALDGVHKGHQSLIRHARECAEELKVPMVVYTFDPPPRVYFQHTLLLTPLPEKIYRLALLGVEHIIVAPFNPEYVTRGGRIFLDEIADLHPLEIWEGPDFRFGSNRDGDINILSQHFHVRVFEQIRCSSGKIISSSRIRELLIQGMKTEAERLLGWDLPLS